MASYLEEALALLDDAIALLEEWDKQSWEGPGSRVINPDLVDLLRRRRALFET